MSFSYGAGSNPPIDYPRMLIFDTVAANHIFEDSEIQAAAAIASSPLQSAQFYSGQGSGVTLPTQPANYYRTAAVLLMGLASNKARLASVKRLLDVQLDSSDASKELRETAKQYLDMDDNSGAFMMIEQVTTDWSFRDRFWKTIQRRTSA